MIKAPSVYPSAFKEVTKGEQKEAINVTDSELRKAFRKGFANPQHVVQLLKRTDLPQDRLTSVRTNLAQAYLSGKIESEALQRFISQLSKAKSLNAFDQVLAELRHANRVIESGVVAKNSLVLTSAKEGRQYRLGGTTVQIDPVHEADALYLGTDGLIHLHEVKNTAKALRNKLKKHPKQLENMLKWRTEVPHKREIRMVIGTEVGWTHIFAARKEEESALQILNRHQIPLTIGEYNLTLASMNTLWNANVKKIVRLRRQNPDFSFDEFYRQMSTVSLAEKLLGVTLS